MTQVFRRILFLRVRQRDTLQLHRKTQRLMSIPRATYPPHPQCQSRTCNPQPTSPQDKACRPSNTYAPKKSKKPVLALSSSLVMMRASGTTPRSKVYISASSTATPSSVCKRYPLRTSRLPPPTYPTNIPPPSLRSAVDTDAAPFSRRFSRKVSAAQCSVSLALGICHRRCRPRYMGDTRWDFVPTTKLRLWGSYCEKAVRRTVGEEGWGSGRRGV
jgi:hypothetical protein